MIDHVITGELNAQAFKEMGVEPCFHCPVEHGTVLV